MKIRLTGICFVTARGWEDLSAILYGYEDMHFAPDENLIRQYLQDAEIARDFACLLSTLCKIPSGLPDSRTALRTSL